MYIIFAIKIVAKTEVAIARYAGDGPGIKLNTPFLSIKVIMQAIEMAQHAIFGLGTANCAKSPPNQAGNI